MLRMQIERLWCCDPNGKLRCFDYRRITCLLMGGFPLLRFQMPASAGAAGAQEQVMILQPYTAVILIRSFLVTAASELLLALVFRIRKKGLLVVLLANVLTNPAYVLTILAIRIRMAPDSTKVIQLFLEALIILIEGLFYKKYLRELRHPWLFSLAANLFSIGAGVFYRWLYQGIHLLTVLY